MTPRCLLHDMLSYLNRLSAALLVAGRLVAQRARDQRLVEREQPAVVIVVDAIRLGVWVLPRWRRPRPRASDVELWLTAQSQ